jgi:hypothetical protein
MALLGAEERWGLVSQKKKKVSKETGRCVFMLEEQRGTCCRHPLLERTATVVIR